MKPHDANMDSVLQFMSSLPWYAWIAIVAITGSTMSSIVRANHSHQQRMAMIKQGMDPRKGGGI